MDERSIVNAGEYRTFDVPVQGGLLRVASWGRSGPVVFCCHGITATHTEFFPVADALGAGFRIVAPDLRGRGRSNGIEGPWGMAAHAADVAAVLDHLKITKADVLLGHSMGGFVAAVAAAEYPERFGRVLMIDGGVPLMNVGFLAWLPFSDFFIEKLVQKIIGPSLDRLSMTFESRDAYRAFWRQHPALAPYWSEYVERYVDYDLCGEAPALRPSTRKEALLRDVRTQLVEDLVPRSLKRIPVPVRFLRASRGLFDGDPLYKEAVVRKGAAGIRDFSLATVDANHFTIVMSPQGGATVAQEIRTLLS